MTTQKTEEQTTEQTTTETTEQTTPSAEDLQKQLDAVKKETEDLQKAEADRTEAEKVTALQKELDEAKAALETAKKAAAAPPVVNQGNQTTPPATGWTEEKLRSGDIPSDDIWKAYQEGKLESQLSTAFGEKVRIA